MDVLKALLLLICKMINLPDLEALATDDNTAKTLDSMAAKIVELQSASNDVMDALTELAGIVAGGGENNG